MLILRADHKITKKIKECGILLDIAVLDNPVNCNLYGGLYQWDEMMEYEDTPGIKGMCPPGWHVPTEREWNMLFLFYTSNGFAGSPLKYSGYSGFNALLSGARFMSSSWNFDSFAGFFWSSTPHGPMKAWSHAMNDYDPSVALYPAYRSNTLSVRCLKD
jgi:uncharacterized protein (TIGR02145 family)